MINGRAYAEAYTLMGSRIKATATQGVFSSWFVNKVSVLKEEIRLVYQQAEEVVVESLILSTDRIEGVVVTKRYREQWKLVMENGVWRLDTRLETVALDRPLNTRIISTEPKFTTEVQGECWTRSIALRTPNAWRCVSENRIFDPAFSKKPSDDFVVFYDSYDPSSNTAEGMRINLTKPLPTAEGHKEDRFYGWYMELADGVQCRVFLPPTGTIPEPLMPMVRLLAKYDWVMYGCQDDSVILGSPEIGDVWIVNKAQLSQTNDLVVASSHTPVKTVWR